nr:MAG TPA: hypothetical protein [Caudoviricetes sp.]
MAEKKQRSPEEMEKALAAANEALEQAKKEAQEAKDAAKAAEAVMRGMSAGDVADDGMVPFWAFKDDDRYKDDIVVGWNGRMYRIQRGKHVRIPREVYNILRRSMAQDAATAEMLEQRGREYDAVKSQLN